MRIQMTPLSTLNSAESVVYAPNKSVFPPVFRRIEEEDASFVLVAHHPYPPTTTSAVFQPWTSMAPDIKTKTIGASSCLDETQEVEYTSTLSSCRNSKPSKGEMFVCPEVHCGKQFPRSFALRRHMRIHTGTKPYACDFQDCSQRFNTSGNLSRHKRIHSGERPYPCCFETCGKRFNTSTKLKRHMRIHFPDGQNLFRCMEQTCSWACDNYKEFVQHQKLHGSVAEGFNNGVNESMNATNDNALDRKSLKNMKLVDVMPSDAESRHLECPQQVQQSMMNDVFYQEDRNRMYGSDSNALMMIQREIPQQREESDYRQLPGTSVVSAKTFYDDRTLSQTAPRLPFPTRAFPSETMGMPSSGLLGLSFHPLTHLSSHRYYDSATSAGSAEMAASSSPMYISAGSCASGQVSYSSYIRSGESNALMSSYQPTSTTSFLVKSEQQYTQSIRQEDMDHEFESSSPHDVRESSPQPAEGHSQPNYGGNSVPAEFTGDELSAVLELMKDS